MIAANHNIVKLDRAGGWPAGRDMDMRGQLAAGHGV